MIKVQGTNFFGIDQEVNLNLRDRLRVELYSRIYKIELEDLSMRIV